MGCDFETINTFLTTYNFNPRTHVGCDQGLNKLMVDIEISIHAPTWGATSAPNLALIVGLFQSTHPRGVRPDGNIPNRSMLDISIHAPTWGATQTKQRQRQEQQISIHAPTWGATNFVTEMLSAKEISIHAPTWGATTNAFEGYGGLIISIHAPTWGATRLLITDVATTPISIHAPTWGATDGNIPNRSMLDISIHAPTWGATAGLFDWTAEENDFNPRTHVGCDISASRKESIYCLISIHAPTWGATKFTHLIPRVFDISIHAPTWGATINVSLFSNLSKFQSTHPRGVRLLSHQMVGF